MRPVHYTSFGKQSLNTDLLCLEATCSSSAARFAVAWNGCLHMLQIFDIDA